MVHGIAITFNPCPNYVVTRQDYNLGIFFHPLQDAFTESGVLLSPCVQSKIPCDKHIGHVPRQQEQLIVRQFEIPEKSHWRLIANYSCSSLESVTGKRRLKESSTKFSFYSLIIFRNLRNRTQAQEQTDPRQQKLHCYQPRDALETFSLNKNTIQNCPLFHCDTINFCIKL